MALTIPMFLSYNFHAGFQFFKIAASIWNGEPLCRDEKQPWTALIEHIAVLIFRRRECEIQGYASSHTFWVFHQPLPTASLQHHAR